MLFTEGIIENLKVFFMEAEMEKIDECFQNQRDNNLNSVAHSGSGFRGREFRKRIKEKPVMKK